MSESPRLRDLSFVDLYIGMSYADVKGLPGSLASRSPVPEHVGAEVAQVRDLCKKMHDLQGEPEFALLHDQILYRVTVMHDLRAEPVYFMRRMAASIRDFARLGLPPRLYDSVMNPDARGLILIAGDMANGKTTTAASLLVARLMRHGGLAIAIEDPPETQLDGIHGQGRCIQVPASRKHGHYREQLRRAMRTGVSSLLIGEIRCKDTAAEAIRQSINGLLVISTIHSKDPVDALTRLVTFAEPEIENAAAILASGLHSVTHQQIHRIKAEGQPSGGVRLQFRSLQLDGPDKTAIQAKIRANQIPQLHQDIDSQQRSQTWNRA